VTVVAEEIVACIENRDVVESCVQVESLRQLVDVEIGLVYYEGEASIPGRNAGGGTDSFDELSPPLVLSIEEARGETA
jgi:hypothetical protein